MKEQFISKIKKILEEEKNQLLNKKTEEDDIDQEGDDVDLIQSKILANIQTQLLLRNKNKLQNIDAAFLRIKDGSFGLCDCCGEFIAEKRLLFNPMFINCITCAEKLEFQQRNHRKM